MLSQKLDAMLKDKIDGELMSSLGNSIKREQKYCPTAESMAKKNTVKS
jgi:hypothetical protein